MKTKVLLITQHFPPEVGAASTRWYDYSRLLSEEFDVDVLTSVPNYPIQKIYPLYENEYSHIRDGNISIHRIPCYIRYHKTISRILNYLYFILFGLYYAPKLKKPDVIIASSPPLTVGLLAVILKLLWGAKLILDVRDIWPESAILLGELKNERVIKVVSKLKGLIEYYSDAFTFAVPSFSKIIKSRKPNADLINGVSHEFIDWISTYKQNNTELVEKDLRVLYIGNFGLAQNLDQVLKSAFYLKNENITFTLVGDGSYKEKLIKIKLDLNLENVTIRSSVARNEVAEIILSHDLCLVTLLENPLFNYALPSKTFEFLAAGKPVLTNVSGDLERLVTKHSVGLYVENDTKSLTEGIRWFAQNKELAQKMGLNGKALIKNEFTKVELAAKLSKLINVVISS